jgi:hypothetical protein
MDGLPEIKAKQHLILQLIMSATSRFLPPSKIREGPLSGNSAAPTTPRILAPRAGPRPGSPRPAARLPTSGPASASAPNAHAGAKSCRSEPSSSSQKSQKFSFRSFPGVQRPNAFPDSVRVRFGDFSDMVSVID